MAARRERAGTASSSSTPGSPRDPHQHDLDQLRALVLLTQTEEQVARTRTAQARTDAVRRELAQNADHAHARTQALTEQLRRLGGVPDVVTPALGRLGALVTATVEQAGPLDEALLGDLQLEHQLLDRATYLEVLAQSAEDPALVQLAERLVTAHRATVEWLTVVLTEEALGGPAALDATPFQRVAGGAARAVNLRVRSLANSVDRAVDGLHQAGEQTADAVRVNREEVGDLQAAELPVAGFDSLSTRAAAAAVTALRDPHDITAMIRYEETHGNRSSVVSAAQAALAAVAKEAVGVND